MKEGFAGNAPVLNKLCPKCSEKCKQPREVVMVSCKYYKRVTTADADASNTL